MATANVKISELPSLSTMTDVAIMPVVAGGVTQQISGANLAAFFSSSGSITLQPNDVTYTSGSLYGNANPGFTVVTGNDDDDAYDIPVDFPIEFLGNSYSSGNVFLVSNSYLTFGPDSYTDYSPVGPGVVPVPAIYMGATDLSNQKYYYGYADGTDIFVIGYEGSVSTSGEIDYPAITWELQVSAATPDELKLVVNTAAQSPGGVWGVSNGVAWVDQFHPLPWFSNYADSTFDSIVIAPVVPMAATNIAFVGPGVAIGENSGTTYVNIDPFDSVISVGDNGDTGATISSVYNDLTLTTARDGDDISILPKGSVYIQGGDATDNQPGNGQRVRITAGDAHDNPNDTGQNYNGGNVEIYSGRNVNNGDAGIINLRTANQSESYNWTFAADGSTVFPTLTVDLHNGGTQTGQVLQFGDGNQQAIITGPAPIVEGYNAQRLIIQGQNGNTGEGGDVYVWGGDSQFNGGDIKIYAGDADNGSSGVGGNIHISGGAGQNPGGEISLTGGTTYNGQGAPVVVTGGRGSTTGGAVSLNGGYGDIDGGTITLTAGYGTTTGGNVDITGGQSGAGLPGYGNVNINAGASSWHFDNTGKITLPNGAALNDTSGESVAFGQTAGATSQAQHAVAIGANAGSLYQGEDSIAIGYQAGYHDQQRGVAIGYQAGIGGTLYKSVNAFNGGSGPVTTYYPWQAPNSSRLYVASTTNIETNQRVFGNNIQANTVVTAVYPGEDRVDIAPNYTAAMSEGDTLTFVSNVIGLDDVTNIVYGMRVTGTDIPINTFVQSTGTSVVVLNQYPTAPLVEPASLQFDIGQGAYSTAIGYRAGSSFQADGAVAIGYQAGSQNQSTRAVAVGEFAGYSNQSANAVAVGESAGEFTQSVNAVAVGYKAGYNTQGPRAVAIGEDAGYDNQGEDAVAVGQKAGQFSQGLMAIAIGNTAGYSGQTQEAVAIGYGTGLNSQQYAAVAIGANAASYNQGSSAVAVGRLAGNTSQGSSAVAVGESAGYNYQSGSAVAVGVQSGYNYQSQYAVAIGSAAGQGQGYSAVYQSGTGTAITITPNPSIRIGQRITGLYVPADTYVADIDGASLTLSQAITGTPAVDTVWTAWGQQGISAVAIGQNAALDFQGPYAVAVGYQSGSQFQGNNAVAIGSAAGYDSQGANSIAIGTLAGQSAQGNNSIILNATGVAINSTGANTFTVDPVRNDVANTGQVMFYNTTSKEITYGNTISVAGNITAGNLDAVNLVINSIASDDSSFVTIEDGVSVNGAISATGSITGGNVIMPGVGGDITMTGGNITGVGTFVTTPVALASLTAVTGARAFVNDGNLVASGNFGSQIGSGGSNVVPVWSDGANWYIG